MKIYKYVSAQYAERMVSHGELLFRALSYFRDFEDGGIREDEYEGTLRHQPDGGLQITKTETGETLVLGGRFESTAKAADQIFVCCFSTIFCAELAATFNANACVEFSDSIKLVARVKSALRARSSVDQKNVPFGLVHYRSDDEPPLADWALPEKIAMAKRAAYSSQSEFRIAFAIGDAFGVENVSVRLTDGPNPRIAARQDHPYQLLKLGNIQKFGTLHYFN